MNLLRIAGATLNQTPLDFDGNLDRMRAMLTTAKDRGVELLCLPELTITGYGCEDAFYSLTTAEMAENALRTLLPDTMGMTVVVGLPHYYYGAMYNCAAVLQDGVILGVNAKRVLPREGVHYEPRWFRPWPFGKVVTTTLVGQKVPFGDLRYRLGNIGMAVEICEEAWGSVPASAAHADAVDLVVNPSASHFALGKHAKRENLVANSSRSMQVIYLYTNLVGCEAGRIIYDGGVLIAEGGEIVHRGPRFGFSDGTLTVRDVNPALARMAKLKVKPVRELGHELAGQGLESELGRGEVIGKDPRSLVSDETRLAKGVAPKSTYVPRTEVQALTPEEEFLRAEMLGLFDYMRKSRSKGYVVSMSGGVDSATCAVLVAHTVASALAELGAPELGRRLGLGFDVAGMTPHQLVGQILTCVYQKTAHSGPVTEGAAKAVSLAIGADFHVADVEPMVAAYTKASSDIVARTISWAHDDIALQNIQARVRAPLVWMIANLKQKILITTSNRSEAAVGYATMDGDTAGGLAPLSGIDKAFLRRWLHWAETSCRDGLGPIAALSLVNAQAPTAELRPQGAEQTDEADLMPYEVLERVERYFVRDRLGPHDIVASLTADFPDYAPETLRIWVQKFLRLWAVNQWKRERYAPGFHLDDLSLDPKTFCRYPILSGMWKV
jgi:NAD+ synthase (glutamine-hydrolysing)